jgi:hypothetical protein
VLAVTRELLAFMVSNRKLWMLPAIAALILFSLLAALTQGSVLAPFIYTIF